MPKRATPSFMVEPTARSVAVEVLYRVEKGAYATPLLDAELRKAKLSQEQAALATEITYGTLRVLPHLDAVIATYARQSRPIDAFAKACLRTAIFQLLYLTHSASHAVVNDAVSMVRTKRDSKLAGFVNAVLRNILRHKSDHAPGHGFEAPEWFHALLKESLGSSRTQAFLNRPLPPPLCLRVNPLCTDRDTLLQALKAAQPNATVTYGHVSPLALVVQHGKDPRHLPGYAEGWFTVQEEGAQIMGLLLDAQPGEHIADACAGHGTKTTLLAQHVGPSGQVFALDRYPHKLNHVPQELQRLGMDAHRVTTHAVDLTVGNAGLAGSCDRVLIDLPCTGLGTVHRRPELLLRLHAGDPDRLQTLQLAIAKHAVALSKPGGRIVLGVCSPTHQEGIALVERIEQSHSHLKRVLTCPLETVPVDSDGMVRLGPWLAPGDYGPDAYQIIQWQVQ